jgi:uncharacterized protein YbjT (DUF2867 family)
MAKSILVTGATGFVGSHVAAALSAGGEDVRAASRNPERARLRHPNYRWVEADLQSEATLRRALAGCEAAVFLIHSIGEDNYAQREAAGAKAFARAAAEAGVKRIVYLGGVMPTAAKSTHLASRCRTGEILRAGQVPTTELRAGMVIGRGSASWQIVSRLAERLPVIPLPAWLSRHSWPIGIQDVVRAVLAALSLTDEGHACYDLPGLERISHSRLMERTGLALGDVRPMIEVPFVSPGLAARCVSALTGVEHRLVRELLQSIRVDLDPSGSSFWERIGDAPQSLDRVIRDAIGPRVVRDAIGPRVSLRGRLLERLRLGAA